MRKTISLLAFVFVTILLVGCSDDGLFQNSEDQAEGVVLDDGGNGDDLTDESDGDDLSDEIDGDDLSDEIEGGLIGAGTTLQGTVTDVRAFASNSLQIKSSTGEISGAVIDDTGRYSAPSVEGAPPYLLRADLGNNEYRYGIAFGNERTNVNSYTNVILQNWFGGNNGNLDIEFEQASITTELPTRVQFQNTANKFFDLIALVLEDYGLTGNQLLVGDYDSGMDNDGIHDFLRRNPIFIKNGKISFVITEPVNGIQSTLDTGIALNELDSEPDTELPSVPVNVRALAKSENGIVDEAVIVWDPSMDNRGVVSYEVLRDGERIAITPYLVLRDTDIEPSRQYTYEVIAVDSSENSSASSLPAVLDTPTGPDNTPPAQPVQLVVTSSVGRMDLTWQVQSQIADVVRFEVYRGRDSNPVEFLASVTGTVFTDISVASGVSYCYQIAAFDASGNASDASVGVCAAATGETIISPEDVPIPTAPPNAGLDTPATESMPCTENWTAFSVNSAMQVSDGCYLVAQPISIENGGSLSLAAGAMMKFAAGAGVVVNTGGSFSSEGTKEVPVILTGQDSTPGYWSGINFNESNSTRNTLVNTVVEYAGGGETAAAVSVSSGMGPLSRVDISNSVIRNCLGAGVRAETEFGIVNRLDDSVISGCGMPLSVHLTGLSGIAQSNDFSGNESDTIELPKVTIDSDMVIQDLGVPYVSFGIRVADGNLTILNGVEVQFTSGANLIVSGSLTVDGLADSRVKFTGTVKERGHWGTLRVNGTATINYADLEFAGFPVSTEFEPSSLRIGVGTVSLSNVSISQSSLHAISLERPAAQITNIDNVVISGNRKTIRTGLPQVEWLSNQLTFSSNDISTIELIDYDATEIGNIGYDSTNLNIDLLKLQVPYLLTTSVRLDMGSFKIQPGVTLNMGDGVGINVSNEATFSAIGTAEEPINLTHETQIPGAWSGITVASNSNFNRIEHARIAFAGGSLDATATAVKLECNPQAMLSIANSMIEDSAGWGIVSSDIAGCAPQLGENVQFNRNQSGDIGVE